MPGPFEKKVVPSEYMLGPVDHQKAFDTLRAKLQVIYDLPHIDYRSSEEMLRLESVIKTYSRLYSLKNLV